ncbi:alpha/beta fold hydrolase [Algoriphagus sp. PAP.12]|uniref:alpha/beta fold hydrolase n=1 Tax=Algoriphagus sp. PAP.12 TaxID=2996678 RepID=UPI00227D4971|nr:alpha/beta hydrolase [Algoriphagus sp. PAP.12]
MNRLIFRLSFLLASPFLVSACSNSKKLQYPIENMVEVNGLMTHYLDFGGEGAPIILLHSESWDATTYKDFGPLLTSNNHVYAITRSGYGKSEKGDYSVEGQGIHIIAFANEMNIDQAIFMGNSSQTSELTYLAENFPERVAALVYFSGLGGFPIDELYDDPTNSYEMFARVGPASNAQDNDKFAINLTRRSYRPNFLHSDSAKINIATLAFKPNKENHGMMLGPPSLLFAGSRLMDSVRASFPPSGLKDYLDKVAMDSSFRKEIINEIQDPEAKEYFLRLDQDTAFQREVYQTHFDLILPALVEARERHRNAIGENLRLIQLEIPEISGYEYRDNPDLIIDHILQFLENLN